MIDLETDDGMRDAFRSIAAWGLPGPVDRDGDGTIPLVPLTSTVTQPRRHPVLLVGAAALMFVVIGAALLFRAPTEPAPAASGSWSSMAPAPLGARFDPVTLWTGTELLVWGGHDEHDEEYFDGAAYDPARDRWRRIADFPFPYERRTGASVGRNGFWTRYATPGAWFEGEAVFKVSTGDGDVAWNLVAYDPETDSWRMLYTALDSLPSENPGEEPSNPGLHSPDGLVAHDGQLLVWGWSTSRNEFGWATFAPATGIWGEFRAIAGSGEMSGFGAAGSGPILIEGRFLTWLRDQGNAEEGMPLGYTVDLVSGRIVTVEVPIKTLWIELAGLSTGGVVVGTTISDDVTHERFAAQLDPATGRWRLLDVPPSGPGVDDAGQLLTAGRSTFYIGGLDLREQPGGFRSSPADLVLDAAGDEWNHVPEAPIDLSRTRHVAVWTGDELVVWGGMTNPDESDPRATVPLADGARYRYSDGP